MRDLVSVRILKGHSSRVLSAVFSPLGNLLASASKDKTVKLWDLKNHQTIYTMGFDGSVYSVAFNPSSKVLAAGCEDKTITLFLSSQLDHSPIDKYFTSSETLTVF